MRIFISVLCTVLVVQAADSKRSPGRSWAADNGNGTYSNPLFYDEFSDPDMIRVGGDYYLTGTTMHAMPGLPILHSRDLVNWRFVTYVFDRLDLGPDFRLEGGKEIYGQGIWAPSFRYHKGTYYIFANVNRFGLQVFRATDVRGPWKHNRINPGLHDLSVLFDDDGKIYAVYGVRTIRIVELNADLTSLVPGTDRVLIGPEAGLGEGSHFYKIKGSYYIVSAIPGGHVPMKCARASKLDGPWEVRTISENESLGIGQSYRFKDFRQRTPPFELNPPRPEERFSLTLHQGGIIDTPSGEWWGYSMQDHNSVGRLTGLSPVTWVDGWPYFGLPGNLTRTPKTWVKPNTGLRRPEPAQSPYERSDDFSLSKLKPVWQWNHLPDDAKWSLSERPGFLRLHAQPAKEFWWARNSLTQRAIGPESIATAVLDTAGLQPGGVAGLALLNLPYLWLGVRREGSLVVELFEQNTGKSIREAAALTGSVIHLRAHCDFDRDIARFSYSLDGRDFRSIGGEFAMPFQLKTFQGVRYTLFHYGANGYADFDRFDVDEPRPRGLTKPIPYRQWITFENLADGSGPLKIQDEAGFQVIDRGTGRIALRTRAGKYVSVNKDGAVLLATVRRPGDAETFQWVDLQRGDTLLLSLVTHRYVSVPLQSSGGSVAANHAGPSPDRKDGSCFRWSLAR
jgi:xylan 1,4-beta-xylosidase